MFNFDVWDLSNFRLSGTIRVSVSDSFSTADYTGYSYSNFSSDLYTASPEMAWTARMTDNVQALLAVYSQLANVTFDFRGDVDSGMGPDDTPNPEDVGRANFSDINISWVERAGSDFSGMSGLNTDGLSLSGGFGYTGGAGDIFLNAYYLADTSLDLGTHGWEVLQHEIGHSLGLSHPFGPGGSWAVTADYAATAGLGFNQLGFRTATAADMNKEYFTVMSYDDQPENAHTPMILDVIALQQAYGEGAGTHGAANDTIAAGNLGYRVYFDKGGVDTIDLAMYESGAYLHMGATSQGAAHLVGVAMSRRDGDALASGSNPAYLRWFYGEYENAKGASFDEIIGNSLANVISGLGGNDEIDGGGGIDTVVFTGLRSQYSVILRSDGTINVADLRLAASDGTDTLTNVEFLQFSDLTMAAPAPNKPPTVAAVAPTRRWVPTPRWR
jgi:hypothetical protein